MPRPKVGKPQRVARRRIGAETQSQQLTGLFGGVLRFYSIRMPWSEFPFATELGRKWRWDYAWVEERVALEVQGGIWSRGRHGRGSGIVKDMAKFNAGAALGWRLLLVEPKDLATRATALLIRKALAWKEMSAETPPGQPT